MFLLIVVLLLIGRLCGTAPPIVTFESGTAVGPWFNSADPTGTAGILRFGGFIRGGGEPFCAVLAQYKLAQCGFGPRLLIQICIWLMHALFEAA